VVEWHASVSYVALSHLSHTDMYLRPSIETTIEYSVKCMRKMQHETIKSIAVKQEALDDIYAHFDEFHKNTVWQEECRSWFKDGKVKNRIYLWPGPVSSTSPPRVS
jgi:hypothetical protein